MAWFPRLCRSTGLMIHAIIKPPPGRSASGSGASRHRHEVRRDVEQKQISPTVTLRRTTIEEIEVKKEAD